MDNEEFKRKLSEVADWHIPKLSPTELKTARRRGRPSKEDLYQEEHEQTYAELFDGINPTHSIELKRLRIQPVDCPDCGRFCENGRKLERKVYTTGAKHWRERCVNCNKFKNPVSDKYELDSVSASHFFTALHRETLGEYQTKFNTARKLLAIKEEDK